MLGFTSRMLSSKAKFCDGYSLIPLLDGDESYCGAQYLAIVGGSGPRVTKKDAKMD